MKTILKKTKQMHATLSQVKCLSASKINELSFVCIFKTDITLIEIFADKEPVSAPGPTKGIPNISFFIFKGQ